MIPIDTATGLQDGEAPHTGTVDVLVGYLVTHPDGYVVRMPLDLTRAELYATKQHATLEAMYVRRPASRQAGAGGAGGANGAAAMPRQPRAFRALLGAANSADCYTIIS